MKTDPLIAVPESVLRRLCVVTHAFGEAEDMEAVREARERIDRFHEGQEEMYEDHAREHPVPVTTTVTPFDPSPYLEEAKKHE